MQKRAVVLCVRGGKHDDHPSEIVQSRAGTTSASSKLWVHTHTHTHPETSVCNYSLPRSCFLVSLQVQSEKIWRFPKRQIFFFFLYRGNRVVLSGFQMSVTAVGVGRVQQNPLLRLSFTVLRISCEVFLHCSDEPTAPEAASQCPRKDGEWRVLSENLSPSLRSIRGSSSPVNDCVVMSADREALL